MAHKLEKFLTSVADFLSKNKVLSAIRAGFAISTPLVLIGSIFLLLASFPINGYMDFIARVFGEDWAGYPYLPVSLALMSL